MLFNHHAPDVPVAFCLEKAGRGDIASLTFHLGEYDQREVLVIDPSMLVYCGYIGGTDDDRCLDIAVDVHGNAYLTGYTYSSHSMGFPVLIGPDLTFNGGLNDQDAFVAKILTRGIWCDSYGVSAQSGGRVGIHVAAGEENAGRNYLILGSASGTAGGIPLPGGKETLPLTWDAFTELVLAYLNSPIFKGFLGKLDANGGAEAQLNAPPLDPGYVGVVLHFVCCLNQPFDFVSNPVPIAIEP